MLGDFGGANVITVYGAYAFNAHLSGELALSHLLGSFSDGQIATIGVTHVFVPEWRIQPFASMGTGLIHTSSPSPRSPRRRNAPISWPTWVLGYAPTWRGGSYVRTEYKNYVVFTDRDENEEAYEWKIGFAFFF